MDSAGSEDGARTQSGSEDVGDLDDTLAAEATASDEAPYTGAVMRMGANEVEIPPVARSLYTRGRELARGGMGRVVLARDARIGRTVAIKELIARGASAAARFRREALLTARLQHPGIIPIYETGTWEDGEPFYAMKLVQGRTLADVISECKTLDARIALLPNVIAVAETLAYAHSRGVIHRDLKPSNVLIGKFGQTLVIDWGLGKLLASSAETELTELENPLSSAAAQPEARAGLTLDGAVMGTPAYIPPEQARGREVDARADVYALGAILYHVLAGEPPYGAQPEAAASSVLQRVIAGPPEPLARFEPRVPADLCAILDKAMARSEDERYPTAEQLVEDLRRFQTGQLVSAHAYTSRQLVARWVRRNLAVFVVALAAVCVLVTLGTIGLLQIRRERDLAESNERLAVEHSHRAEEATSELEALLDFMLVDLRDKLQPLGRLDLLDLVAARAVTYYDERPVSWDRPEQAAARAIAFRNLGDVYRERGDTDSAATQYRRGLAVFERLAEDHPDEPSWREEQADCHRRLGRLATDSGSYDEALAEIRESQALCERILARSRGRGDAVRCVAQSHDRLGDLYWAQAKSREALEEYRAAHQLRAAGIAAGLDGDAWQEELGRSHYQLGRALWDTGDVEGATSEFESSRAIQARLVEQDPDDAERLRDLSQTIGALGRVVDARGRHMRAIELYEQALQLQQRLVTRDPDHPRHRRGVATMHAYLAGTLTKLGRRREAAEHLRACSAAYEEVSIDADDFYNGACCASLSGDVDRAFAMLDRAVDRGWRDAAWMSDDADLTPLRADPRWAELLERVRAAAASDATAE